MRSFITCQRVVLVILAGSLNLFADVFYVSLSGSHTPPFNSWETAATNLQGALDIAGYGHEIRVADGTHLISGPLNISQAITVRSENGPGNCMIEGQDMLGTPQLSFSALLEGFTLRNPHGFCVDASSALLRNCVFPESSMATLRPGAILESCTISNGVSLYCDTVVFTNCAIGGEMGFFPGPLPVRLNSQTSGPEQSSNSLHHCTLRNVEIDPMGGLEPKSLWHFTQCDFQDSMTIGAAPISGDFHGTALLTLLSTIATNLTVTNFNPIYISNAQFWNCALGGERTLIGLPPVRLYSQIYGPEQGTNSLRFCTLRNVEIDTMSGPDPKLPWHFDQCDFQESMTIGEATISGDFHGTALLTLLSTIATNLTVTNFNPIYVSNAQFWNCALGGERSLFGMPPVRLYSQTYGPEQGTNLLRFCTLRNVEIDTMGGLEPKLPWHFAPCEILESVSIGVAQLSGCITGNGILDLLGTTVHYASISNVSQLICWEGTSISNSCISHSPGRGVVLKANTLISHSRIMANQGGGIACEDGGRIRNCLISGNQATEGGGVLLTSNGHIESCTIVGNSANAGGGVMSPSGGEILNSIVWNNSAPSGANWEQGGIAITWSYNCTTPAVEGTGNLAADPQLTPDYTLSALSPCIQTGTNQSWMSNASDLAGHPRIINRIVDIGAFEYIHSLEDSDGDSVSDAVEIIAGSDPTDAQSFFGLAIPTHDTQPMAGDDGVVLSWYSFTNKTYRIRRADDLVNGFTNTLLQGVAATPPMNTHTDSTATAESSRFYRVEVEP